MEELWKPIKGLEKTHEASTLGRVRVKNRKNSRGSIVCHAKIINFTISAQGYYRFNVRMNGKRPTFIVHRVIAETFLDPTTNPKRKHVNHKDGNKLNNRVDNLEWCTHQENIKHAILKGLCNNKGTKNGMSKFTENQIREIRQLDGLLSYKEIAKKFNSNKWTIGAICRKDTYKDVI